MKAVVISLTLALTVTGQATAQDTTSQVPPALTVSGAVVARSVIDRTPQDTGSVFPADVAELVFFTRIAGAAGETTIHHVWFHGDAQVADVELRVGGSPWRTWSRKTIPADWTGAWHVEVRDGSGAVLQRVDFTVGQ